MMKWFSSDGTTDAEVVSVAVIRCHVAPGAATLAEAQTRPELLSRATVSGAVRAAPAART